MEDNKLEGRGMNAKTRLQFIAYARSKAPRHLGERLIVKMSPHKPPVIIERIRLSGVETKDQFFTWDECSDEIIATVYQRLKLHEAANK